ncbi:MAG: acylhydrolase [Candidatus Marinimicrobia bacterium]|nr:acylhydrolase [Candidatus Neomarinimicrobiota bacterium]MBT3577118.1 acylhydrolase [Candidatus Neomarinimicrobiota bacterium]MBT3680000.1 acylhydrolase [Candidatus Neomarinimicrobiota bacterium]MBT3949605.1 acylhydrolase [Candidatus Neomarinimicrobiota bacterium]MBT4253244.1 acylhydrolase [Candidatus Neomarinimicrobiota bacterium]
MKELRRIKSMRFLCHIPIIALLMIGSSPELVAQDWANLKRFQKENQQLSPPTAGESRVVLMGNSITEGWPKFYPEFFESSKYIARGISGQTTPQMLLRFRQDVIDLKPDVVVILAGTNDIAGNTGPMSLDEIHGYIVSMCELALANHIHVVLSSVLPAYEYPWKKEIQPAEKIVELNKMLQGYAEANGITYLDYFAPMADSKNGLKQKYTYDGVHPNKTGYIKMSKLLKHALKELSKGS